MVNIINMLNHLASKNINPHSQSGTNTKGSEIEGGEICLVNSVNERDYLLLIRIIIYL